MYVQKPTIANSQLDFQGHYSGVSFFIVTFAI